MKSIKYIFKIKPVITLVILLSFVSSCNDWIDIEPEDALIQQEFWKTKDDVMEVLAATYRSTRNSTLRSFVMGEVRADIITADGTYVNNWYQTGLTGSIGDISVNDVRSTNELANWGAYYNTINLANTVMFYAPIVHGIDQTLNEDVLRQINSEMIFLRSLSYFYLVRIWKDVPLVKSATVSDTVNFYLPKSSETVVLKSVINDLKRASGYASKDASIKGRANKYAIQALLADMYLWKEDYAHCITYCDSIINSGKFGLESNKNWFKLYYPGNSQLESIFEIQFDDAYEGQESYFSDAGLWGSLNAQISKAGFDKATDLRYINGKGIEWKYLGKDETGSSRQKRSGSERSANFIYYRYADILLMKAEALAETGNFDGANNLVSQVAERAGTTYTGVYDLKSFRTALLTERGKEFIGEGKRWFDLLRFAKKDSFKDKQFLVDLMLSKAADAQELVVMRSKVIDSMSYFLPIYENELNYNRNLVQNPFYDR